MRRLLAYVILFTIALQAIANNSSVFCRRHIIIAVDGSASFLKDGDGYKIKSNREAVRNMLIDLLNNQTRERVGQQISLVNQELLSGVKFYDPQEDALSFFWFAMDIAREKEIHDSIFMAKKGVIDYSDYIQRINSSLIHPYVAKGQTTTKLNDLFSLSYNPRVTLSELVYPIILEFIANDIPAEEYVLVIASDFKSGSYANSVADWNQLNFEVMGNPRGVTDSYYKKYKLYHDQLSEQFYRIDYFKYVPAITQENAADMPACFGYRVKPMIGKGNSDNVAISLESDLNVRGTFSGDYTFSPVNIKFVHNKNLLVDKVIVEMRSVKTDSVFCVQTLASRIENKLLMEEDSKIIEIDSLYDYYHIPKFKIHLNNVNREIDDAFKIKFRFVTRIISEGAPPIPYIYTVQRELTQNDIVYINQKLRNYMTIASIILLLLIFTSVYLYYKGKPLGILLRRNCFADRYEDTDFSPEGNGRMRTEYKNWTLQDDNNRGFSIRVEGRLAYRDKNKFYNWRESGCDILLYPMELKAPSGFSMYVSCFGKMSSSSDKPLRYDKAFKDSKFEFNLHIRKDDSTPMAEPKLFRAKVDVKAINSGLFNFSLLETLSFEFFVGPELGNVWIGVDPGTTGSCVATATKYVDLTIQKDEAGNDFIYPSVVCVKCENLEYNEDPQSIKDDIRNNTEFGNRANAIPEDNNNRKFVSIKKLLGYNETFELKEKIHVQSSFLSTLLIEKLLLQNKNYIEENQANHPQFIHNGIFETKRAVFAIPNNFTASKIQELKQCIMDVENNTFKEIRFIYEAEAILVYYINSTYCNTNQQNTPDGENVFIYDMGGATINVTIANVRRKEIGNASKYEIKIIAKLGYGIGGDTIDYAYLKWIYSKQDAYPTLKNSNPFIANSEMNMAGRRKLKEAVLGLKKTTINSYREGKDVLIDRRDIAKFNGLNLEMMDEGDVFNEDLKRNNSFLESEFFKEYVYDNISSICNDILQIGCGHNMEELHTVLMSGRSSCFPKVKDCVETSIHSHGFSPKIISLGLEESKSAVAKGACYYGTQNDSFILKNLSSNGVFGVVQTLDIKEAPVFYQLIKDGEEFKEEGKISGKQDIEKIQDFRWDGHEVEFYQVMGINPEQIIANQEKHKFSKITSIPINQYAVSSVQMTITNKDKILCSYTDVNNNPQPPVEGLVNNADIMACNDEQYTFFVKQL